MIKSKMISCFVMSFFLASGAASFAAEEIPSVTLISKTRMLQGRVSNSEYVPKLDPRISIGAQFDESMFRQPEQNDEWYQIPYWFAGTFSMSEKTIVDHYNYQTGLEVYPNTTVPYNLQNRHGYQLDSLNTVWDCRHVPYISQARGSHYIDIAYVYSQEPIEINSAHVILKSSGYGIRISSDSNCIIKIFPHVDWEKTYYPDADGRLQLQCSCIAYDNHGDAIERGKGTATLVQTASFQRLDRYGNEDLRDSFRAYLLANGLANLVPSTVEIRYDLPKSLDYISNNLK